MRPGCAARACLRPGVEREVRRWSCCAAVVYLSARCLSACPPVCPSAPTDRQEPKGGCTYVPAQAPTQLPPRARGQQLLEAAVHLCRVQHVVEAQRPRDDHALDGRGAVEEAQRHDLVCRHRRRHRPLRPAEEAGHEEGHVVAGGFWSRSRLAGFSVSWRDR